MMQQILAFIGGAVAAGVPAFAISYLISRAVARRRNRRQAVPDTDMLPTFAHEIGACKHGGDPS